MRFVLGTVNHIDPKQKVVSWAGPEGVADQVGYDRLILTAGSVNKLLPIPGIADYAHGFRSRGSQSRMGHRDPHPRHKHNPQGQAKLEPGGHTCRSTRSASRSVCSTSVRRPRIAAGVCASLETSADHAM